MTEPTVAKVLERLLRSDGRVSSLTDRLQAVIEFTTNDHRRWKTLEDLSGIAANSWMQMARGKQRPTAEMTEAVSKAHPEFAFWIATGLTDREHGHTAPVITDHQFEDCADLGGLNPKQWKSMARLVRLVMDSVKDGQLEEREDELVALAIQLEGSKEHARKVADTLNLWKKTGGHQED